MNCGATMIATVHAGDLEDLKKKPVFGQMMEKKLFKRIVVMSGVPKKGTVVGIYDEEGGILWSGRTSL